MIDLPLTHDEWDLYLKTLCDSHVVDFDFRILDRDEQPMGSMRHPSSRVLDGSIQLDATADVSKSLECTILDPHDSLQFQDSSPAHAAVFADRFIDVDHGTYVPELDDFIYCPLFRGPLTNFSRDGLTVSIEAQGKESRWLTPHLATLGFTLEHGMRLDDAITKCALRTGEKHIHLPQMGHRLKADYMIEPDMELWPVVAGGKHVEGLKTAIRRHHGKHKGERQKKQNVAGLIRLAKRRRLMYDNRGRLTARHLMSNPHFVFRDGVAARGTGRGPSILSRPQDSWDETEFINTVIVRAGKPKGKERIEVKVTLPPRHPMSPVAMAHNGEPVYNTAIIEAPNIKKVTDARKRGEEELRNLRDAGVNVTFDALPMPFLEEGDRVAVKMDGMHLEFPMRQATFPLTSGDSMAVGYNRTVDKFAHRGQGKHRRHDRGGSAGGAGPPGGRGSS